MEQYSPAPSSGGDGYTTTPAIHGQSERKTTSTPLPLAVIPVGATPPNTTGIGALQDLERSGDPPASSWALYSSRPSDSTAKEALHDQTIGSTVRSPESCTDHRDWYGYCREPADHEHLDGSRRLQRKSFSHTKRPSNKKPPPRGWLDRRSRNDVKAQ